MKKYIIFSVFIILSTFILINHNLLPNRIEIGKTEIIEVIGLDYINGKPSITIIRNNLEKNSGSNETPSKKEQQNILTITSETFQEALQKLQILADKYLSLIHVEYILIGENIVKDDFNKILDFLGHSNRIGVNAKIFLIKNMSTSEFINKVQNDENSLKGRLDNMLEDDISKAISKDEDIDDVLKISLRDSQDGVIPVLSIINKEDKTEITDKDNTKYFFFDGLAVIKNMKLVGYIENEDVLGFNIITSRVYNYSLKVEIESGFIIAGINNIIIKPEYIFENNKIKKIKYNINLTSKIEAFNIDGKLVTVYKIKDYEKHIKAKLEKIITNSIKKCFEFDVDYFYFKEMINRKNPYKYRNMKLKYSEDCFNVIKKAEIEIDVSPSVKISYDMINTNSNQKGI